MAGLASSIALSLCPSPRLELNPKVPVVVLRQQTLLRLVGDAVVNNEQIQVQERTQAERHQNSRKKSARKSQGSSGTQTATATTKRRRKEAKKKSKKGKLQSELWEGKSEKRKKWFEKKETKKSVTKGKKSVCWIINTLLAWKRFKQEKAKQKEI